MKLAKVFSGFVVIALFTLFATANLDIVRFNLYFWSVDARLFMIIYASFGAGFVVAWFLSSQLIRMCRKNLKKRQKQFENLVKERDELRNQVAITRSDDGIVSEYDRKETMK